MNTDRLTEQLVPAIRDSVTSLPQPTADALRSAEADAEGGARVQLEAMLEAMEIGERDTTPICQDTGVPTFFVKVGRASPFVDQVGEFEALFTNAVRQATEEVPLRPNTVHPITHENPGDNTGRHVPYIEYHMVDDEDISIHYLPKGGGSENMSQLTMMTPGRGLQGVKDLVLERVATMEGKPCPPTILGIGLGGGANIAMNLAKETLLRPVGTRHQERKIADLERELKEAANQLEVGPMGVGGQPTVLDVKIEYAHRHPGSFPVGMVPQCWCNRRAAVSIRPDGSVEVVE
jgi:fumarate hydratase subunit alpha